MKHRQPGVCVCEVKCDSIVVQQEFCLEKKNVGTILREATSQECTYQHSILELNTLLDVFHSTSHQNNEGVTELIVPDNLSLQTGDLENGLAGLVEWEWWNGNGNGLVEWEWKES